MDSLQSGKKAFEVLRSAVRTSPWLAIAALLHVIVIAILSVMYIAQEERVASVPPIELTRPRVAVPTIDEPPSTLVPIRDAAQLVPDVAPGEKHESTDYIPTDPPGAARDDEGDGDPTKEDGTLNLNPEADPDLLSGEPGGTSIGVGKVGHPSFGVSPFSTRKPGEGGKGGGGPSTLKGKPGDNGLPRTPDAAVDAALVWLKNHQAADGSWDSDGFQARCKNGACEGVGQSTHDAGATGLALLCYLGANFTPDVQSPFRLTVVNGLKYLKSIQDADGCFGQRVGQHFLYDHACAALAMAEAYGMTKMEALHASAQNGVNFTLRAQNPYAAWRYAYPPNGDNDTSVTGWMVMVLKSAKMSGLTVDEAAMQSALNWVTEMTDVATGRTGYTDAGGLPSRPTEQMERFPAERSESMTAVGVLTRIFAGQANTEPMIEKGANLMAAKLPRWEPGSGDIDFYYWYYGTLAMFQVGGARWERWNDAMKSAILGHQHVDKSACEYGSWDPLDPWSSAGGRVYSTALNCLSMEVYYRYPRVFGGTRK